MVATNGYTDRLHRGLQRRVLPIGSFVVATEPLTEALAQEISPGRRNMVDSKHFSYYFRLTPDNRLIFGGRARFALSNPESDQKSASILHRGLTHVFPQLHDVKLDYAWGGTVAFTFDQMLHVGNLDGVYYALGYCGHGVQMASYLGHVMAEVMDGRPEASPGATSSSFPCRSDRLAVAPSLRRDVLQGAGRDSVNRVIERNRCRRRRRMSLGLDAEPVGNP